MYELCVVVRQGEEDGGGGGDYVIHRCTRAFILPTWPRRAILRTYCELRTLGHVIRFTSSSMPAALYHLVSFPERPAAGHVLGLWQRRERQP